MTIRRAMPAIFSLTYEWQRHLGVIAEPEDEIGIPLRQALITAISTLEKPSYLDRIERSRGR